MDAIVFESSDRTFFLIIEQALADNGIPCTVTGGADVGLMNSVRARICVPDQYRSEALEIVRQILE